ncbi:MAG: hypothetical protein WBP40_04895 [Candidatus Moraniibacteriota bacterium]
MLNKNWISAYDIFQDGWPLLRRLFSGRSPAKKEAAPKHSDSDGGGSETITENAAQAGELYSLLAWLSSLWIDDKTRALEYRPKPAEAFIFPRVVAQLPPGAINRFMQTIAVEVVPVKYKKTTGFTEVRDPQNPSKVKKPPIFAEWEDMRNVKGEQIANAVTWLVTVAQGTEDERVAAVAKALQDTHVLDNIKDEAAAGLKATAEKTEQLAKVSTKNIDTWMHLFRAWRKVGWKKLQEIRRLPTVHAAHEAIAEAAEGQAKLDAHEAFQDVLVDAATAYIQSDEYAKDRLSQQTREGVTRRLALWIIAGGGVVIILALIIIAH